MVTVLLMAIAGGIGAVARYLIDGTVQDRTSGSVPWGTMTVNMIGSLVMGLVTGIVIFHATGSAIRQVVGTGFCGGMTTWSSASWETVRLFEEKQFRAATFNLLAGTAASAVASLVGFLLATL